MKKDLQRFLICQNLMDSYRDMSVGDKGLVKDVFNWQNKQLEGLKELFLESDKTMSIIQIAKCAYEEMRSGVINGRITEGNTDYEYWLCVSDYFSHFNKVIKKYI